jgi:phosphohistidine phosphatase
MRRLLLLRHAKAERAHPGGGDKDRVLAERGRTDAKRLGAYLTRHDFVPDRALVSSAARTRETWTVLSAAFDKAPTADFDDRLYNATPNAILDAIQNTKPNASTLLVIGHNPGIHGLAAALAASGDIDARERLGEGFPTSGLAVIGFASDNWRDIHPRNGRLEHFITPDWLASAD